MTVCIAAIAEAKMVLLASDRMLTVEDVEYEPKNQTKIFPFTNSIAVMAAGDSSLHAMILHSVWRDMEERIAAEPKTRWMIEEVVDLYRYYYDAELIRRAEAIFLTPLGLTRDSFITRQSEMTDDFIRRTESKLLNYTLDEELQVIICGLDRGGVHIYMFVNGEVSCRDIAGFAAIGVGARHAESQLEFAGHSRFSPFAEALMNVYSAKKRAEAAPGIGKITDMFCIGPGLEFSTHIAPFHIDKLESEFRSIRKAEKRAANKAIAKVQGYWDALLEAMVKAQQQQVTTGAEGATAAPSSTEP